MIRNDNAARRPLLAGLVLRVTVLAWADRLLVGAKARLGQIARPSRPSRHELKQALWALAGCVAIIISMAGATS